MTTKSAPQRPMGEALKTPKKEASKYKTDGEPLYHEITDGLGQVFKLANVRNTNICKKEGAIEIESIIKSNFKDTNYSVCNAYDPELDLWFGKVLGIDPRTKQLRWQRIYLGDHKFYDLGRFKDATEWGVISRCPVLLGSPFQVGKPLFKVYDREEEAQETIKRASVRTKALEIVGKEMKIEEMSDVYRCFGKDPAGLSVTRLHAELIKIAEQNPKQFYDAWTNENKELVIVFYRSLSAGVINYNPVRGGYMFKDSLFLGVTETEAMKEMDKHKSIIQQADMESKTRVPVKKNLTEAERKFYGEEEVEFESARLIELRSIAAMVKVPDHMSLSEEELEKIISEKTAG